MRAAVDQEDAAADTLCRSLLTGPPSQWREVAGSRPGNEDAGVCLPPPV